MVIHPDARPDHGKVRVGADDPSLTAASRMVAVAKLCRRLGLIEALGAEIGPVERRERS